MTVLALEAPSTLLKNLVLANLLSTRSFNSISPGNLFSFSLENTYDVQSNKMIIMESLKVFSNVKGKTQVQRALKLNASIDPNDFISGPTGAGQHNPTRPRTKPLLGWIARPCHQDFLDSKPWRVVDC